jgi:hypothetical protein
VAIWHILARQGDTIDSLQLHRKGRS